MKEFSNSYNLWKFYMISTFCHEFLEHILTWKFLRLFYQTLWTILSTDKNRGKMFQMTIIDLKRPKLTFLI